MRKHVFLAMATLCLLLFAPAFAAKRSKIECSKVSMTKLAPGWGKLPAALQKLPPGATLCGSSGRTAFITSALDRNALEKFYAPLFASLGCKLTCKQDDFTKTDSCDCPKAGTGSLAHDTGYIKLQPFDQAYQLFFANDK